MVALGADQQQELRRSVAEQRPTDLVLVQLKRPVEGASILAVSVEPPEVGEHLFTVSSPLGLEFSASDGICSARCWGSCGGSRGCPITQRTWST